MVTISCYPIYSPLSHTSINTAMSVEIDASTLAGSSFPVIIRDTLVGERVGGEDVQLGGLESHFVGEILEETKRFTNGDLRELLEPARIGSGQIDINHRSDRRCWLTPSLCKEHGLRGVSKFAQNMMKYCRLLGENISRLTDTAAFLNGEYSIQLAVYVSL